jgi:hypothetical protein
MLMRRPLAETQQAFAAALAAPDRPVPSSICAPRRGPVAKRFAIYRNNVAVSLIDALAARFPVTLKLVGEEFFRAMAREYAAAEKPKSPVLIFYGGSFPEFVSGFSSAKGIAYLADVAAIEAAWTVSYHAADLVPLSAATLSSFGEGELAAAKIRLLPSVRLLRSAHPAGSIWLGHQSETATPPPSWTAEQVMLVRPDADVQMHLLTAAEFAFMNALANGCAVERAAEYALIVDENADPGAILVKLIVAGAAAAIEARSLS